MDKGNLATIGRGRAVADLRGLRVAGPAAWALWLAVHLLYLIGFENRLLVLLRWTVGFVTRGRGARLIEGAGGRAMTGGEQPRGRRRAVLGVMCLALMMVVSAVASLNVALPDLARDTGATQTELQWIVDAYALVFACLLLPAGALGDRYGRKGILLIGLVVFGATSLVAIFVNDAIDADRPASGNGSRRRTRDADDALDYDQRVSGRGARPRGRNLGSHRRGRGDHRASAFGDLVGVVLVVGGVRYQRDTGRARALGHRADRPDVARLARGEARPGGGAAVVGRAVRLVFAIIEAPQNGWLDPVTLVGLRRLAPGWSWLRRLRVAAREPMLDPRLFARRGFGVGSLSLTLQFFAQFGLLFVVLQYLQFVLGYSPLQAGLSMLPMALMLMVISPRAPRLAHRLGVRVVGGIGLALMGAGFLVFSTLGTDSSYWHFGIGALITGIGIALATAPATTAIVSSLPANVRGSRRPSTT